MSIKLGESPNGKASLAESVATDPHRCSRKNFAPRLVFFIIPLQPKIRVIEAAPMAYERYMRQRRFSKHALALLGALFFVFPASSRADWITLRDGRREQCVILEMTPTEIRVERTGVVNLPMTQVVKVERESSADNAVLRAAYAFNAYKTNPSALLQAIRAYSAAHQEGASGQTLCSSLLTILQTMNNSGEEPSQEAMVALADLLSLLVGTASDGASEDFFLRGSHFLAHAGRMDPAIALFGKISEASRLKHPEWQRQLTDLVAVDIQALIADQKMEDALERLLVLGRLDPRRERSSQIWAQLAQADIHRRAHRHREAIDIYATQTAVEYPEVARTRTVATIREAIDDAAKSGLYSKIIPMTMGDSIKLLGQKAAESLRAQVYRQWGLWALKQKQYEQARECMDHYSILSPSDGQTLLDLVSFHEKLALLPPNDPEAHYQLGVFCRERGLDDQAREQFSLIARDPNWGQLATKQLADLENQKLESLLNHAIELKNQKAYQQAREEVARVLKETTDPELEELARRAMDVILKAMEYEKKKDPLEAEVLWQQAERCILPDENQTCLELLNRILRDYGDTSAAKRAAQKKRQMIERGARDTVQTASVYDEEPKPTSAPATKPKDELVDPVRLREELLRLQKSLETVAEQ